MVDNPVAAQKVAIPAIRRAPSEARSRVAEVKSEPTCSTEQSPRSESVSSQESVIGACKPSANENESQCEKARATELPPLCACSPDEGLDSLPISEHVLNTTFCAIAEKLVNQYNARGLDVSEIQQKLRKGFIRSSSEEACRVQNQVLFQVLDEISGQ